MRGSIVLSLVKNGSQTSLDERLLFYCRLCNSSVLPEVRFRIVVIVFQISHTKAALNRGRALIR